jgi:PIN domain nuclease of toxin-antitoxin system
MSVYVTDTHPLVWYAGNRHSSLSAKVLSVFQKAENAKVLIYVPSVVFWEIALLNKTGRIKLGENFERWSARLLSKNGFAATHLETEIIAEACGYNFNNDPFDAVIVATARLLDLPLIRKDAAITESNLIEIYW